MPPPFISVLATPPPAVFTQFAAPAGAHPAAFAADWDEKDLYTLLKLSCRPRFIEVSGNQIRGFIADLELYLQMCVRPVHYWGYFLLDALGTEEAKKSTALACGRVRCRLKLVQKRSRDPFRQV